MSNFTLDDSLKINRYVVEMEYDPYLKVFDVKMRDQMFHHKTNSGELRHVNLKDSSLESLNSISYRELSIFMLDKNFQVIPIGLSGNEIEKLLYSAKGDWSIETKQKLAKQLIEDHGLPFYTVDSSESGKKFTKEELDEMLDEIGDDLMKLAELMIATSTCDMDYETDLSDVKSFTDNKIIYKGDYALETIDYKWNSHFLSKKDLNDL